MFNIARSPPQAHPALRGARVPLLALTVASCAVERWLLVWLAPWLQGDALPLPGWVGGRLAVKWVVRRLGVALAAGLLLWVFVGYRDHWKEMQLALQALQQQLDAAEHRYTLQLQAAMEGQRRVLRAMLQDSPTSSQAARAALPAPAAVSGARQRLRSASTKL